MSLFPRFGAEFSPLFRLMDDYERIARSAFNGASSTSLHSFNPKFDVREVKDAYELHGELPGIDQANINIEWSDGNTLTITGRSERRSERGTPPAETAATSQPEAPAALENSDAKSVSSTPSSESSYQKPTVEDEATEGQQSQQDTPTAAPSSDLVTTTPTAEVTKTPAAATKPASKYWVTERSVGEFHRAFSFPARVDQEAVTASLRNGILSIVVPKAKKVEPRRVEVNVE